MKDKLVCGKIGYEQSGRGEGLKEVGTSVDERMTESNGWQVGHAV